MSDEKSQQQTSTESTVAGAAKTGKAISNIAKGAAAGGAHGAAIEAGKSSAKWLIPLIAAVLLPLILVAMLPSIIFGSLLGDGTDSPNGISNDEVLVPQTIPSKPLLTLSITAARTTRISTTLSIVTAHVIRSITTSLRSNTDSVRNSWKAPSIIPT